MRGKNGKTNKKIYNKKIDKIPVSKPIRYERYYINDKLRIQNRDGVYEKEILDDNNIIISKIYITSDEFNVLKNQSYTEIIGESYMYLKDTRVSIKNKKNQDFSF